MRPEPIAVCNEVRRAHGFLEIGEILALVQGGTAIFDPFSTLIGRRVRLGSGNLIYPGVTLLCAEEGELAIGGRNIFYGGTLIAAENAVIEIGDGNQFGEGGFVARANRAGARIQIGNGGRYLGGAAVYGETDLGSGSQLLGMISVDGCRLGPGGSYKDLEPDKRGGLLKGIGTARNLVVGTGEVIAGNGTFSASDLKPQSFFHPKVN